MGKLLTIIGCLLFGVMFYLAYLGLFSEIPKPEYTIVQKITINKEFGNSFEMETSAIHNNRVVYIEDYNEVTLHQRFDEKNGITYHYQESHGEITDSIKKAHYLLVDSMAKNIVLKLKPYTP